MSMTKKDYERVAQSIADFINYSEKAIGDTHDLKTVLYLTGWIAQDLKNDNPRFDTDKFTTYIRKATKRQYNV